MLSRVPPNTSVEYIYIGLPLNKDLKRTPMKCSEELQRTAETPLTCLSGGFVDDSKPTIYTVIQLKE